MKWDEAKVEPSAARPSKSRTTLNVARGLIQQETVSIFSQYVHDAHFIFGSL